MQVKCVKEQNKKGSKNVDMRTCKKLPIVVASGRTWDGG